MNTLLTISSYSVLLACIGDASAPANTCEAELDERLRQAILMEDSDLVFDLKKLDCNQSDNYLVFWKQCEFFCKSAQQYMSTDMIQPLTLPVHYLYETLSSKLLRDALQILLYRLCSGYVCNFI